METVVVLLMLLGVSRGVETYCDGRQDGAQCYGALGGAVDLQLMDKASEIPRYEWKKGASLILNGRNNNFFITNTIGNKSTFIPSNGTLKINNLNMTDSGEYTLTLFDSNGQKAGNRTLKLSVEAPVSSAQLVSECLSQGEMKVSCSSQRGDSHQYSWTLDGHTLTDTELLSGSNETNITLKQHVSGRLVCSVRNHISSVSKEEIISNCGFIFINCTSNGTDIAKWVFKENNSLCIEPTTTVPTTVTQRTVGKETDSVNPSTINTSSNHTVSPSTEEPWFIKQLPIIAGVLSALVILLVVGTVTICAQKKKQNNKAEEEDDQDIIYADVRMVQRQKRQVEQRAEPEVEYGQVKFSERPRQTESPADDVYAKVRKGR